MAPFEAVDDALKVRPEIIPGVRFHRVKKKNAHKECYYGLSCLSLGFRLGVRDYNVFVPQKRQSGLLFSRLPFSPSHGNSRESADRNRSALGLRFSCFVKVARVLLA